MDAWAKPVGNVSASCGDKSLRLGILALALALGLAVSLHELSLAVGYRAVLFVPFYVSAMGLTKGLFGV